MASAITPNSVPRYWTRTSGGEYFEKVTFKIAGHLNYAHEVKFFYKLSTASNWISHSEIYIKAGTNNPSRTITFNNLIPGKTYNFKAVDRWNGNSLTKTTSGPTDPAKGTLTITATSQTYTNAKITGMTAASGRRIQWYYKKHSASSYTLFKTTTLTASATSVSQSITGLAANTAYDIKAVLQYNTLTGYVTVPWLQNMVRTVVTPSPTPTVPTAILDRVEQVFPLSKVRVYWESPGHIAGTTYQIQAKKGSGSYSVISTLTAVPGSGYTEVTLADMTNSNYTFKITSTNSGASGTTKTSNEVTAAMQAAFTWDTFRYANYPFDLTANEWNRLIEWTRSCLEHRDIRYEVGDGPSNYSMTEAVEGQPLDNEMFNQVADAVEAAMATSVYSYDGGWTMECLRPGDVKGLLLDRKEDGDPVKAYDLVMLQQGANNMFLEYTYADIAKDETDEYWLHPVVTADTGHIYPLTSKIYVVVGECQQLLPSSAWTHWWFEDQHVTLYRWHPGGWDMPRFEKIKDVWIYR